MRTKSLAYILPSIAFLLLVCLHWAQPPTVIAQIDLPPAYDPGNALAKCAFVWSDYRSYFGSVDACFSWLPYRLVEWAMYAAFGASYGQALVFGAAVIISWLGGFACARALGVSEAGSFVTAWLYAFNPARQSMFGLFATGEVCAALLPWVLYWIVVAAHEPQRRAKATFAIAGLSFAALVVLAVTPQLLAAVLLAAVIAAAYFLARSPDRAAFASWAGATFAFVVAAGSWWLVPDAISYLGAPIAHAVAASSVAWTFARASLLNELRFCATWFWQYPEYNPWAVEFERNPWFYVSGFAPVACAVAALIVCTGERLRFARFFCGVALVMLFIAKGVHAPLAQVNTALYALPGMFLFIEPDGPILIAALAFAVCAGFAADSLLRSPRAFARAGGAAFSGLAVALVLWNNAAAITGAIFHEETQATPGVHIALPDYWRKAAAFLNSTPQPGGVVILPVDDFYQADYDWGYHGVDTLPGELIHRPVLMPGAPWGYTVLPEAERLDGEIGHLVARHAPQTAVFLSRLGIRYALVRYDVRPVNHGFVPAHDDYATLFAGRPALVFGKLEIFDLGEASAELRGTMATSAETATAQVTEARQIAYAALPKSRLTSGDAVPSVIGQAPIDSTTEQYQVFNPGGRALDVTAMISAWPRWAMTMRLESSLGYHDARPATAGAATSSLIFPHVILQPGETTLTLREPRTFATSMSAFAPPRYPPDDDLGRIDRLTFARIETVRQRAEASRQPALAPDLTLRLPMAADPQIEVVGAPGAGSAPTGWRIQISGGKHRLTCLAEFWTGQTYALDDSIRQCLSGEGLELTASSAAHIVIDDLSRATDAPLSPSVVTALELTRQPLAPAPADSQRLAGRPGDTPLRDRISGFGAIVSAAERSPMPIVLAQAFSPTWIAFDVSHPSLLPHFRANGWANGWQVGRPATIVLVNWASALSVVLFACGFVVVVLLWRRA